MESKQLSKFYDIKKRFFSATVLVCIGGVCLFYGGIFFQILCGVVFSSICYEIFSHTHAGHNTLKVLSVLICFFGVMALVYAREMFGFLCCVVLILIASFSDLGGYFIGKSFGGFRPFKRVSPNKTISGFIGAFLVPNVLCVFLPWFSELQISILALQFIIVSAIFGDLYESYVKRVFGIKDFSDILPGHGGIYDRFDSLIFVSIAYCFIRYVF